jgi:tetratricopeptide (TPR) repeat protein
VIVAIYFLPRVVVDNEKDREIRAGSEDTETGVTGEANEGGMADVHSLDISETDLNTIKALMNEIQNEGSDQLVIADSLVKLFISYNQYDSAAKYLDFIAGLNPGIDRYENAGNAYYEALGFALDKTTAESLGERARYYYHQILNEDPSRFDIKNKLAMTFISTSSPMQGIALLREILEEDAENETALFNLGILAIQSGQYGSASERFKNLVSLYPQNLQGQFYLGLSYYELGDKDNARKQFELVKSMEEDPAVLATVEGYLRELN